jgi:hypothetical protein
MQGGPTLSLSAIARMQDEEAGPHFNASVDVRNRQQSAERTTSNRRLRLSQNIGAAAELVPVNCRRLVGACAIGKILPDTE